MRSVRCRVGWHRWREAWRIQWSNNGVGEANITERCARCADDRERHVTGLPRPNVDITIP